MVRSGSILLFLLCLFVSCTPALQTARVTGKRGALYPQQQGSSVLFRVRAPGATLVTLAGTFNSWNTDFTPLQKGADGVWSVTLTLKPGLTYQYKYLVDGHWIPDPANPIAEEDGCGGYNSVLTLGGQGASR